MPEAMFSKERHPVGGYLRRPFFQGKYGMGDVNGREAGEDIEPGAIVGIGEDGRLYAWPGGEATYPENKHSVRKQEEGT